MNTESITTRVVFGLLNDYFARPDLAQVDADLIVNLLYFAGIFTSLSQLVMKVQCCFMLDMDMTYGRKLAVK